MVDIKKLLGIRANTRAKRPLFIRQSSGSNQSLGQKVEVGTKYRRPKGYHSKLRKGFKGTLPSCGYRAPAAIRGTNPEGKTEVVVNALVDLKKVNAKTDCVIIGSTVGKKNKIAILEKVVELKLNSNIDAAKMITDLKTEFAEAKAARSAKKASRAKAAPKEKETKKKTSTKKEKSEESVDAEDDKSKAKKEQEKILINKDKAM